MFRNNGVRFVVYGVAFALGLLATTVGRLSHADDSWKGLWTDPSGEDLPVEFQIQGEYVGQIDGGQRLGCQVICLGPKTFQAVVLPGGLPGDGWDEENQILLDGTMSGSKVGFKPANGNKQYLAKEPERFSATRQFPPQGQRAYTATIEAQTMCGKTDDGKSLLSLPTPSGTRTARRPRMPC